MDLMDYILFIFTPNAKPFGKYMISNLMIAYVYISPNAVFHGSTTNNEVVVFVCIRLSLWYHLVLAAIGSTSGKLGLAAPFLWQAAIFVATCCGLS